MSGAPSFNGYPNVCGSEVDAPFDLSWDGMDFGQQQSRSPYSTHQIGQLNTYGFATQEFPGQPPFEYTVPFPGLLQDATRNGLPRIDTKTLGPPRLSISDSSSTTSAGSIMPQTPSYSWTADGRLHVFQPPGTPLSPSNVPYPAFSPSVCLDKPIALRFITINMSESEGPVPYSLPNVS
ncbi:hypothetical protein BDR07DRAFT_404962 [Suillus spraguei]|nr:hypothetical protein BDR07DRAFT_404962 [Suillus spraguei]